MTTKFNIPGYEILHEIGEGGMASVFEGIQTNLDRRVAIKVLSEELMPDEGFRDRFLAEGKVIANLNHPNIMTIFDCGASDGFYYMTMELISGGTLHERIGTAELDHTRSIKIISQMAQALECAHENKLVHRDVKPANVLFRDERTAVLGDFGIAKALEAGSQLTQVGTAIGTPDYMSPEQALALPVTHHSDIYSLGVMTVEMLTGTLPMFGDTPVGIAARHIDDPIPKLPSDLNHFQPLINLMLARDPNERFATTHDLVSALDNLQQSMGASRASSVKPTEILEVGDYAAPQENKSKWMLIAGSIAALTIAGAGGGYYYSLNNGSAAPEWIEPSVEVSEKIDNLMTQADENISMWAFTSPPGSNALENYQDILKLNPNNPKALEGIVKIADQFEKLARESKEKGEVDEFNYYINEGLYVQPSHSALIELKESSPELLKPAE